MDPWMLHMLPARGRPYNSGSAYIFVILYLLHNFAIANHIAIGRFTALESPSNHFQLINTLYHKFVFKLFVLDDCLQTVHRQRFHANINNFDFLPVMFSAVL